ncbi:MAG TPA: UDP-N-acetylmuramate--L-alanine ligase [Chroococcidiopsis sp.]
MLNSVDFSGRPFHFIGIGGIGMSALAYVLAKRNLPVSGSDICLNHITQRLQDQGAHVFWSQDAANLEFYRLNGASPQSVTAVSSTGAIANGTTFQPTTSTKLPVAVSDHDSDRLLPQVICSTAINPTNPEYRAALELGCPIFHRSDVLARLMQDYRSIAVAGTHGKTTTSSMLGYLLLQAGLDPTIVVGGEVNAWNGNAYVGNGPYLVAEADESDGSLVKLAAEIGVITNIELDHPDHYSNLDEVVKIFKTFTERCKILVACLDCTTVSRDLKPTISYSLDPAMGADYSVENPVYKAGETTATVLERGKPLGQLTLKLLGKHNLSNALAVVAIGRLLGLEFSQIASILVSFEGARRRFERRGEYNGILVVDDYAHHPSEIQVTLAAARIQADAAGKQGRLVAVFQPHRYSRTQAFLSEFATSFGEADLVITTDIYGASEANAGDMNGPKVADAIASHHPHVVYQPTLPDVMDYLKATLVPGDLVLFLGAGNLNRIIPDLLSYYQSVEDARAAL